MKRLVAWPLALGVALVVLFYAVGGWYFSGQIDATGLLVRPAVPDRSLEVSGADSDTVTLSETQDEVSALREDMTYGLAWDGGYGQVSGAPRTDAAAGLGAVTRQFRLLEGHRPSAETHAGLERDAYPAGDPAEALGVPVRAVRYTSPAGTFPAWFVSGTDDTWAIFTHGAIGATRAEALRAMATTVDLGLPSLAITYRNDPGVPGDPSGRWAYGRTEWRDLEGAVRYALQQGAHDVVLVGYSMGGGITASFLRHSTLAAHVSKVVLDAPMLDFAETVDYGASQRTLPLLGTVPPSLAWTARQIAAVRYDIDWDAIDYLDDSSWLTKPTLVFHGTADTRVPLASSRALADAHPDLVSLRVVPGAGHVEAWNHDPHAYDRTLRSFLR